MLPETEAGKEDKKRGEEGESDRETDAKGKEGER
jgi:hypothetical protein